MGKIPKVVRELAPEGTHNAVLVHIVDIGTHTKTFEGKSSEVRQIHLGFESQKRKKDGEPFYIPKRYTFSGSPKANLMKDLKAWGVLPKQGELDLDDIKGKPALVTVEHSEDEQYANIVGIGGLPSGMKAYKPTEPLISLFLNEEEYDQAAYDELPEWLQDKIAESDEYVAVTAGSKKKAPAKKGKK